MGEYITTPHCWKVTRGSPSYGRTRYATALLESNLWEPILWAKCGLPVFFFPELERRRLLFRIQPCAHFRRTLCR